MAQKKKLKKKETKNQKLKKMKLNRITENDNSEIEIIEQNEIVIESEKDTEKAKKAFKDVFGKFGVKLKSFFKRSGKFIKKNFNLLLFSMVILITLGNVASHIIGSRVLKDYDDYSKYNIKYNNILSKSGTYYVYFYSTDCSHCEDLKKYIFQYIDSDKDDKENGIPIYLFCIDEYYDVLGADDTDNILGVTNVEDLKMRGTPTMILVADHEATNAWSAASKIKDQLKN